MIFKNITIIDECFGERKNVCVGVKDGKIAHIGEYVKGYGEEFDGNGYLLVPAFCSAHSHNSMSLLRGVGTDLPLDKWLNEAIFPEEAKYKAGDYYNGALSSCAEMLKYGVVGCNDMYFCGDSLYRAYNEAGIKVNMSLCVFCFDPNGDFRSQPIYREYEDMFERLGDNNGRIRLDYAIHAEYTNTEKSMTEVTEMAVKHGTGIHVHVSETESEHKACIERHGVTPTGLLEKVGAFNVRLIGAHCVWCTDNDYEIFAKNGAFMASCPTSNLKLGSGIPDYQRALSDGVKVALGTDGVASNNNLNMLKEAKLMALLTKGYNRNPALCKVSDALSAATRTGWLSMGRQNSGLIKVGMDADLAVFDIASVNTKLARNAADTLLYSCDGEAYMTMCDGKVLYKNGEYTTIDIEKLKYGIGE